MLEYNENTNTYELTNDDGYSPIEHMTLEALVRQMELEEVIYED